MQKYGEFLKNERISRKLSQEQLAKEIGITQQSCILRIIKPISPTQ